MTKDIEELLLTLDKLPGVDEQRWGCWVLGVDEQRWGCWDVAGLQGLMSSLDVAGMLLGSRG